MFLCKKCHKKAKCDNADFEEMMFGSYGPCEDCHKTQPCVDCHRYGMKRNTRDAD